MSRSSSSLSVWISIAGVLYFVNCVSGLKGNVLVLNKLRGTTGEAAATVSDVSEEQHHGGSSDSSHQDRIGGGSSHHNDTSKPVLTGIPQVDYKHDPNLPRELNGYNLTDYPFYDRVPEDLDFKCDGLHDGFYASVLHKCQVYHHCLFGTRYDFLCANYTAFDQKTFICHFVSEVDCNNSPKYFNRNEALYKAVTTTTTTVVPPPPPPPLPAPNPAPARRTHPPRRRRPYKRRRPQYEYYDDEEYEDDLEYYDDEIAPTGTGAGRRKPLRPPSRPVITASDQEKHPTDDFHDVSGEGSPDLKPKPSGTVYDRPRVPPKIRRPVPLNEREKYDYSNHPSALPTSAPASRDDTNGRQKPVTDDVEYYDDEEEYVAPARPAQSGSRNRGTQDYYPQTAPADRDIERRPPPPRRRRPNGNRRRVPASAVDTSTQNAPLPLEYEEDYDDASYEDEPRRVVRPSANGGRRRVKQPARQEPDYRRPQIPYRQDSEEEYSQPQAQKPYVGQGRRNTGQGNTRYEDEALLEPIPAPRPAYISSSQQGQSARRKPQAQSEADYVPARPQSNVGRRPQPVAQRRPVSSTYPSGYADEEEYYDDEEEEVEEPVYRARPRPRPSYRPSVEQGEVEPSPPRSQNVNKRPAAERDEVNPLPPRTQNGNRRPLVEQDEVDPLPQRPQNANKRPSLASSRPGNTNLPRTQAEEQIPYSQPARQPPPPVAANSPVGRPVQQPSYRERGDEIQHESASPVRANSYSPVEIEPSDIQDDDIRIARPNTYRSKGEPSRVPEVSRPNTNYHVQDEMSEKLHEPLSNSRTNNYHNAGNEQRTIQNNSHLSALTPVNSQTWSSDNIHNTGSNLDNRNYQSKPTNKYQSVPENTERNINNHNRDIITNPTQRPGINTDNRYRPVAETEEPRVKSPNVAANSYKVKPLPSRTEPSSTTYIGKYRDHTTTQAPFPPSEKLVTENFRQYTNTKKSPFEVTILPTKNIVTKPVIRDSAEEDEAIPLRHNLADVIDAENDVTQSDTLLLEKNNIPSAPAQTLGDLPRFRVKLFKTKLGQSYIPATAPSNTEPSSLTGYGGEMSTRGSSAHLAEAASQRQITRTVYPKEKDTSRPYSQPLSLSSETYRDRRPQYNQQRHSAWQVAEELSVYQK